MTSKVVSKKAIVQMPSNGITAWSISRLNVYEQCPYKTKLTVIDKLKEPGSEAMDRGTAIHKEGELYLTGHLTDVPASYKLLIPEMEELRRLGAKAEVEVTFTKDWVLTGWFDKNAWVRIKIDALVLKDDTIHLIDFKTGKVRPGTYDDQLELYALAGLLMYPDVKHISGDLYFTDSGDVLGTAHGAYTQADVVALKKKWEDRVAPMFADDIFAPRANKYCGFCHFRKANNGPCVY